jgi:hypothetical protein
MWRVICGVGGFSMLLQAIVMFADGNEAVEK